jgi:gliding motility-associated-like protein
MAEKTAQVKTWSVLLAVMLMSPQTHPFTSTQLETYTARVVVEGFSAAPVQIRHTALQGISSVTQEAFIQGEVGLRPRLSPDFAQRMTPESPAVSVPADKDLIRVTLRYRIANPDGTFSAPVQLPSIEGPDPMAFAFQINPDDIGVGSIQYQLFAERLQGTPRVVVKTSSYPPGAIANPDDWATVGVDNQAAQVFTDEGGRISIPDGNPNDGISSVDVPANTFGSPTQVTFTEIPLNSLSVPAVPPPPGRLALYQFNAEAPFNGTLSMTLLYQDFQYPNGQDGIIDGTTIPEGNVSVVWWDGAVWRRLNAIRNPTQNTLSFRITSAMKYFAIVPNSATSPEDGRPREKIITPNGDGANDQLVFNFFDTAATIRVEIFDVTGHRVRTLSGVNTLAWDGRDDSGDIVESGVYIYQYTDTGKRISGVVAVAK